MKTFTLDSAAATVAKGRVTYRPRRLDGLRLLVYSHDTFGLGNIRRMLAVCEHLRTAVPGLSILVVSGSPMLHSFRAVAGIDYIKLPCLRRTEEGELGVRYLSMELEEIARLRRELILATAQSFQPDALLVDKVPDGLLGELEPTLSYLKSSLPHSKVLLVLRDILDSSQKTSDLWLKRNYYSLVQWSYDAIAVLGEASVFDVRREYGFPEVLHQKTWFCGYIAKHERMRTRADVWRELGLADGERLVLVTTGGGEDGYQVLETYLHGVERLAEKRRITSLIVTGPDLSAARTRAIRTLVQARPAVRMFDFTDDMLSYVNAADTIVSMAGYNTICEILTLRKRAVVIPRVQPVQEQRIRAERMASRALFKMILPAELCPRRLMDLVAEQLDSPATGPDGAASIDLGALPRITRLLTDLLGKDGAQGVGEPEADTIPVQCKYA